MDTDLITVIEQLNPWFEDSSRPIVQVDRYIPRIQADELLSPNWDQLCTVIIGPRQAGKTTLGLHICEYLLTKQRFTHLLYLSCDIFDIRSWLRGPQFIKEAMDHFRLVKPIVFIDEVQRLENPGLLLKSIIDLKLPIKLIATGSSQLEIKSRVQEYLTGRQFEVVVLPLSWQELKSIKQNMARLLYGCYPQIVQSKNKEMLLKQLFRDYINKDIIEILRIGKPDVIRKLIELMAHSSGQLINYNQLATDCRVTIPTIQNYLSILEKTYVVRSVRPFVGNKRTEVTTNPVYYFIDNGFRNQALNNFAPLEKRTDRGLLIENYIFQEIYKFKLQYFDKFTIYFWRTKSGAEVDFVLYKNIEHLIPVEVKYQNMREAKISKGFRSFLQAYRPTHGIVITKSLLAKMEIEKTEMHFISLDYLDKFFMIIKKLL